MKIISDAFQDNEYLPAKYARVGKDINPPLTFSETPPEAVSLALTMDDPDAPGRTFTHWVVYNIAPGTLQVMEGTLPMNAIEGMNDYGEKAYGGPAPPFGTHRYIFTLYALDTELSPDEAMTAPKLHALIADHTIDTAKITALYSTQTKKL